MTVPTGNTTQPSLKEIVDSCPGHVRAALQQYVKATTNSSLRARDVARGRIEGYLVACRNTGNLLQDHGLRLLDEIKTPDGYRIIGACFPNPKPIVTDGERSLWRWQYKLCGGFERSLWDAILAADSTNLGAIEKGFPEHVEAYRRYGNEAGYWDNLCERINA